MMMDCHLLFLVVCSLFQVGNTENDDFMSRKSEILHGMCLGANVCQENETNGSQNVEFRSGLMSCCKVFECSCAHDCKKTNNCCLPGNEQSSTHNDINRTIEYEKSCLLLSNVTPMKYQLNYYNKYNMIVSVRELSDVQKTTPPEAECGRENVAPWGSLFPVFSKAKNRLYKNFACAVSDGSLDVVWFNVFFICEQYDPHKSDFSSFVENGWISMSEADNCRIEFQYPGKVEDLKWHTCFMDLVNSCPSYLAVHSTDNLEFETLTTCDDEIKSLSLSKKWYASIVCQVCMARAFQEDLICAHDGYKRSLALTYNLLIDRTFLSEFKRNNFKEKSSKKACKVADAYECRPIHCPSWQLYVKHGKCNFPSKVWFNQKLVIALNLTTVVPIKKSDHRQIFEELLKANFKIQSPWPKHWHIFKMYLSLPDSEDEHFSLHTLMHSKLSQVRPTSLFRTVKKTINRKWTFHIANKTVIFSSDFSAFYVTPFYNESNEHFLNQTKKIFKSQYQEIFKTNVYTSSHPITKLFLCNQVELTIDEFIVNSKGSILFSNITNRYLFWSEFILLKSTSGIQTAKVCVEDSGLKEIVQPIVNSSADVFTGIINVVTSVIILFQIHEATFC